VFCNLARIKRELYKSESSKEDCKIWLPQKLLWTRSEFVNKICEKVAPANEVNCKFDPSRLQSEKIEKSNIDMRLRKFSE
jgi:hypothetical protein